MKLGGKLVILVGLSLAGTFAFLFLTSPAYHRVKLLREEAPRGPVRTLEGSRFKRQSVEWANSGEIPGVAIDVKQGVHYSADYDIRSLKRPDKTLFSSSSKFQLPDPTKWNYRVLSWEPTVLYFPNFTSPSECDHIVEMASGQFFRSQVKPAKYDQEGEVQDIRTSQQAWLSVTTELHRRVEDRIKDAVGTPDAEPEVLQVLKYEHGQHYGAHNDYFDPEVYGTQSTQRFATFFLYFSDVDVGGETYFPRANGGRQPDSMEDCSIGLRVKPIKGSATLFYGLYPDGALNPHSLHGGCPVGGKGQVKLAGTKWYRVPT